MTTGAELDLDRFKKIARKKIKESLSKYLSNQDMVKPKGGGKYKISIPYIEMPRFKFDSSEKKGFGNGKEGNGQGKGDKPGPPGQDPGSHSYDVDFDAEDLFRLLKEELELPNLEPKQTTESEKQSFYYKGISKKGPRSLIHKKRTFKTALKREIASGDYSKEVPKVVPIKEDFRYRVLNPKVINEDKAVIFFSIDISGSMGQDQRDMAKNVAFWCDFWISNHYKKVDMRYLVHDTSAWEVSKDEFFGSSTGGGTKISSAYEKILEIIAEEYPVSDWNIYIFHLSDGDNFSNDNDKCLRIIKDYYLKYVNMFSYIQVKSSWGSGEFKKILDRQGIESPRFYATKMDSMEETLMVIKGLFKARK